MNENTQIKIKPIKGQKLFQNIFIKSKKITNQKASIYISFARHSNLNQKQTNKELKYAAMVRKKLIKKAVCRNRAKRLIRVCIRELFNNFKYSELAHNTNYIIVFWNKPFLKTKDLKYQEVFSAIEDLFNIATQILNKLKAKENIKKDQT